MRRRFPRIGFTLSASALLAPLAVLAPSVAASSLDVQGHRGCRGLMPENTMPAFERALELGVSTLELDVQATRDRVLVVHHDQRVSSKHCLHDDGRKPASTPIKDLDLADLADIDCGRLRDGNFPDRQRVEGARIPTLEQVLLLAREASYPVRLSIEIKLQKSKLGLPPEEMAGLLADLVERYELVDRVIVQSFEPDVLGAVRRRAAELPRALLVRGTGYRRWLDDGSATILSPKLGSLTREELGRLQAAGIPVIVWTVNKPQDIRRMIDWGVDGIISDYPDRVLEALAE